MQRFTLSTRVDSENRVQVELHDREKEALHGPPFADHLLGGGILTVKGDDIEHIARVRDVLNAIAALNPGHCSPAVYAAIIHMTESKMGGGITKSLATDSYERSYARFGA